MLSAVVTGCGLIPKDVEFLLTSDNKVAMIDFGMVGDDPDSYDELVDTDFHIPFPDDDPPFTGLFEAFQRGKNLVFHTVANTGGALRACTGDRCTINPSDPRVKRSKRPTSLLRLAWKQCPVTYMVLAKTGCGYCRRAIEHLESRGLAFTVLPEKAVGARDLARIARKTGHSTFPFVWRNGVFVGGYTDLVNLS